MFRKRFMPVLITVILGISMVLSGCSQQSELTKVKLSEVTHSVFYAPQYVAMSKGFFKEEGLEVELTNGQGADKVMTAVLSGQVDIGFAGPEASVYVHNEGKEDNSVVFAQLTNGDGTFLMGREPDPDFKWSDLKGKTVIGGRKGGMPAIVLQYVLSKNGMAAGKDVTIDTTMQFAAMPGAFIGGQGDYVIIFEPTASSMEKEGKAYIVASLGKESGEIPYTAYFAKKSMIEKNPELIQKFTNAIYKGQKWVASHTPEEIALAIKLQFPEENDQILISAIKRYKEQNSWKTDPILQENDFYLLQQIIKDAGELNKIAPYEKVVTKQFGENAIKNVK
ncbi:ABC transporter substrate-binding protein [Desulfosporosinus hippei]|uniref:NitT/TauT family transport system substrate-binding protein n=1 Tax=Desulfosporosinus hippei DSM 8344 TaxID=1121419 RepID=A0A1G7YHG4_9FIRM|nr:ABC transporter substrate-binding protein [Desulfosporosinus hippei]SDG95300.1 NitT/TauT family transport system substrate-binding protein [Desulfosporosinus hippei DSM 8344]